MIGGTVHEMVPEVRPQPGAEQGERLAGCPRCHRSSSVTKVSTIELDRTAAPELAERLRRPRVPTRALGATFPAVVVYVLGLSVTLSAAAGLGHRLFPMTRVLGSGYAPDDLLTGLGTIADLPGILITLLVGVVLIAVALGIGLGEEERLRAARGSYRAALARWERAYYCSHDEAVFLAEEPSVCPPKQFERLLRG